MAQLLCTRHLGLFIAPRAQGAAQPEGTHQLQACGLGAQLCRRRLVELRTLPQLDGGGEQRLQAVPQPLLVVSGAEWVGEGEHSGCAWWQQR